jgi:formyl-CoA transferase
MLLGDLGADVIKVERPGTGDETRKWGPPFIGGESAYFLCCNRNKRSITLDLKSTEGQGVARSLAERCDVLIENFRVGGTDAFGLGYEQLKEANPGLVYCSVSGYGHTGPDRNQGSYDFLIQGRAGFMSITGNRDGPPTKVGVAIVDVAAGLFACNGVQAALLARERTGKGRHVDIALLDSQIALLANVGSGYLTSGVVPERWGNTHASIVPYQAFRAKDGYIVLAIGNDGQWSRFCKAADVNALAEDQRYRTNPDRVAHRSVLVPELERLILTRTVNDWLTRCHAADVPAGPVNTLDKVFADPQALARGMKLEVDHPAAGKVPLAGSPLFPTPDFAAEILPPPMLGQHTDEILKELAIPDDTITSYRTSGIV